MTRSQLLPLSLGLGFLLSAGAAHAGPNAGGTLIIHAAPGIAYTDDLPPLCEIVDLPGDCSGAVTNLPGGSSEPHVWWIAAAFPNGSSPRLAGVTLGVHYDDAAITLVDYGPCGDFELHDEAWPAPGSGTAITWGVAQTDHLVSIYGFAGYEYYGNDVTFCVGQPAVRNAVFADDSVPSQLDPVVDFGCLGFNGDPGYLACPDGPPLIGACCVGETCVQLTEADCSDQGGTAWYLDTPCEPNPCAPVPTVEESWGRIKGQYR
ncbi:MAG: hypothetical protein KDA27_23715 [Candidatus Eisenbacteria bacterium]|uniref:Uncharacterized protein n=1 Tax=Eiseniibacteriota bacterium TaxID=2212470 RepID=A0A956NG77_UNCEI|nr:hypothetical protein [Candidatus Eisenbacteria bacterium]MCB9464261.1 hypothetical protein [Candidatus Eisenbacteria bacterium]